MNNVELIDRFAYVSAELDRVDKAYIPMRPIETIEKEKSKLGKELLMRMEFTWYTGTPTKDGWYLAKVTDVDKPYEVLKFENGKWSDYLDYDDIPEVVNDSFVLAYQKIEPYNLEANCQQITSKLPASYRQVASKEVTE